MVSAVIFAILSFGLRAGIDSRHISISFQFDYGYRFVNHSGNRGGRLI